MPIAVAVETKRCRTCRVVRDAHVDPLAGGGAHAIDNIVPACGPCNSAKGAKTLLQFLAGRV